MVKINKIYTKLVIMEHEINDGSRVQKHDLILHMVQLMN